jgi:hypothetical protein
MARRQTVMKAMRLTVARGTMILSRMVILLKVLASRSFFNASLHNAKNVNH